MAKQNTKLSGYNPNRRPSSMPSYLGLPRISSWKKFANLLGLDTPNKLKCDCLCTGRSMVEMLGVLAIVGVLSVGAIAGYSKAMMKYRLNKHAESLNLLINYALQNFSSFGAKQDRMVHHAETMHKLGLIPDGITYRKNSDYLKDIFGTNIVVYTQAKSDTSYNYGIAFYLNSESDDIQICRNIPITAKENRANIKWLTSYNVESGTHFGQLSGDKYCTSDVKCLKDMTLDDIDRLCNKQTNVFYILWD